MKNIAIINVCNNKSTGKIAVNLLRRFVEKGYNAFFFYGRGSKSREKRQFRIDFPLEVYIHAFLARFTGLQGYFSYFATRRMIRKFEKYEIDTIVLINPHTYYLNEKLLYSFIADNDIRFIYIIPDEYAYLGKCAVGPTCSRWKTGNGKCPDIHCYPTSWFFNTCPKIMEDKKRNYTKLKKAVFVGPEFIINNMRQSYLGRYMKSAILDEAIDINLYHPTEPQGLRKELGIENEQIIVLCIAPPYKGVKYFKSVANHFKKNNKYCFVHVGKDDEPLHQSNYIHVSYVEKNSDLAIFYSLADLFLFPSMADTMSNACLESLACGTPLLVFNISGMPYLLDSTVGTLVEPESTDALIREVSKTKKKTQEIIQRCRSYAEERYDMNKYADRVIDIALSN